MRRKLYLVCTNHKPHNLEIRTVVCRETLKMYIIDDGIFDQSSGEGAFILRSFLECYELTT